MKLFRAIPAIAAVALLGACSPMPSTAIVVNGTSFSNAQVEGIADACNQVIKQDEISPELVVQVFIIGAIFDQMAKDEGQAITDEQVDAVVVQQIQVGQTMLNDKECAPFVRNFVKATTLSDADQALVKAARTQVAVEVNPRYGRWDPLSGLNPQTGSISIVPGATLK